MRPALRPACRRRPRQRQEQFGERRDAQRARSWAGPREPPGSTEAGNAARPLGCSGRWRTCRTPEAGTFRCAAATRLRAQVVGVGGLVLACQRSHTGLDGVDCRADSATTRSWWRPAGPASRRCCSTGARGRRTEVLAIARARNDAPPKPTSARARRGCLAARDRSPSSSTMTVAQAEAAERPARPPARPREGEVATPPPVDWSLGCGAGGPPAGAAGSPPGQVLQLAAPAGGRRDWPGLGPCRRAGQPHHRALASPVSAAAAEASGRVPSEPSRTSRSS
jgi:hypothetical protein